MKEVTQMPERLIPPALNKRAVNSNKGPKQMASPEIEHTLENQDKSPPKKKKPPTALSTEEAADLFESTTKVASREISMMLSTFAEVLSERAAADTSQIKELEDILAEAENLESNLKETKKHLRQTLTQLSDKLQG